MTSRLLLAAIAGYGCGWVFAHHVVAKECRDFARFYVGATEYSCAPMPRRAQ